MSSSRYAEFKQQRDFGLTFYPSLISTLKYSVEKSIFRYLCLSKKNSEIQNSKINMSISIQLKIGGIVY